MVHQGGQPPVVARVALGNADRLPSGDGWRDVEGAGAADTGAGVADAGTGSLGCAHRAVPCALCAVPAQPAADSTAPVATVTTSANNPRVRTRAPGSGFSGGRLSAARRMCHRPATGVRSRAPRCGRPAPGCRSGPRAVCRGGTRGRRLA